MIRAVIFDLDGVLVDSEPLWERAGAQYLRTAGVRVPRNFHDIATRYLRGTGQAAVSRYLKRHFQLPDPITKITADRMRLVRREFLRLKPMPGTKAVVKQLSKRYTVAVASSGPRETVNRSLRLLGIRPYLTTVVTGNDIRFAKPHPQIYRLTAHRLHCRPDECAVVEDSIAGQKSAHAAGMPCLLLKTPYTTPAQLAKRALIVPRLRSLPNVISRLGVPLS